MRASLIIFIQVIALSGAANGQVPDKLLFKRVNEPKEQAFSILIPGGWGHEGGIMRVNPVASGAANAIEAKVDYTVFSDSKKTVQIHWLPDIYYYDASQNLAGGMFPEGSNYNGMLVLRKRPASVFVKQNLIPYLHPEAGNLEFIDEHEAEGLERILVQNDQMPGMGMKYDAFVCDYSYNEAGIRFRERMICVVVDMGPYTAGMWKNSNTILFRAPENQFRSLEPVFSIINRSVVLNSKWVQGEIQGQIKRGQIMVNTMQEMNRIDQDIQKAHMKTNSEINHQAFLVLTDQEDYINPHTGQVETGSNQWGHRWVDDLGNVLYTDASEYNPNLDIELNMTGFKLCKVKK